MRIKQLVTALSCAAILVGCGSGVNSSAASQNIDLQAGLKTHAISQSIINDNLVFTDSLGVLPLSEASSHNYLFRLNNASAEKYTLVSLSLDGKSGETQVENDLLSVSIAGCSVLDASSSCSIQLTPKTTKSANTMLVIKLKDSSGKIKELHQMVRMSDSIFSANGIAFANDLHQVVTADGNYSIALPVILSADFDDIKVANGSLQCDGGYSKGNACTYLISGKSLSDSSIVSAEVIGYRAGVQVAKISQDILVKTTAQASLLLSQGTSTTDHATSEVVVYNNGNAPAHGLKLVPDAQLKLVSGAECLSHDLPAHSACSLKVANSSESNGYAALGLYATDAVSANTQIRNAISQEKLDLSFSASGSLMNTLINTVPATQTITIKNTSDRQLRNFNIQLASIPATLGLTIAQNDCTSLAKNQTCSVVLKYAPNGIVSNSVNLIVTATYTDDNNQTSQLLRNYQVNYSSIQGAGVLSSSEFNDFEIISNGAATQRQTFSLSNTKPGIDTKLTAIALETAVSGLVLNNGTCAINSIIKGGESCSGNITYGGVNKPATNQTNRLKFSYSITTSNSNTYTENSSTFRLNAKVYAANIEAEAVSVADPKPLAFEGDGSKDKPYKFIALKERNPLVLNYTFTNKGNAPAKGFKLTGLDNNLVTTTGTCSLSGQDLKPNESCSLKVVVPAGSLFANNAFNHTSIADLALAVSYRYSDQNSDFNTEHAKLTKHIQFTRNWANVQYSNVTITEDTAVWNLSVTATHNSVNSNLANDAYPITITPTAPGFLDHATVTPCQINNASSSCVANVSFPKTNFPVASTQNYNINLEAHGKSLDKANAVFGQIQFALMPIEETINLSGFSNSPKPVSATTKKYGGSLSVPYTSVGFLVAPWSDAKFPANSLSWDGNPELKDSPIEVSVININNGNHYTLKVKAQSSNLCYWYALNAAITCSDWGERYRYAYLEIKNDLNLALPAGHYKGNFELIAKGWHDPSFVKRIKVNIDWHNEALVTDFGKYYYIKSYNKEVYLEVLYTSTADGTKVIGGTSKRMNILQQHKHFKLFKNSDGGYNIIVHNSAKGLHIDSNGNLIQSSLNSIPNIDPNASFDIFYEKGKIKFRNRQSGKCLQSTGLDTQVRQFTCSDEDDSQLWEFVETEKSVSKDFSKNGVKIVNFNNSLAISFNYLDFVVQELMAPSYATRKHSIKYIGMQEGLPAFKIFSNDYPYIIWAATHDIGLNEDGGSDPMNTWRIYDNNDGTYSFMNRAFKDKLLDITPCGVSNGTTQWPSLQFQFDHCNRSKWWIIGE